MSRIKQQVIIKDTHRALWYEDGILTRVVEAGRYEIPPDRTFWGKTRAKVEVVVVDVRQRELTIKGQEILTADKVAVRVSIIVQFRVVDATAAMHEVDNYEERLYSDVQLAARRSLASMKLEEILTNRNRLSEDILRDVKEVASRYGVAIMRADVKDLAFPGNLQEIMNKVLAAERTAEAQLVDARTRAQMQQLEAETKAATRGVEAEAQANAVRLAAQADAEAQRIKSEAALAALTQNQTAGTLYSTHPALLRLQELETLRELSQNANARIYIGFDKHFANGKSNDD